MTECNTKRLEFHGLGRRDVVAQFDGGQITSDAGGLLLREMEQRTGIIQGLAGCFIDQRDPRFIEHSVEQLVGRRVYGLCLGYEDLNDHAAGALEELKRIIGQIRARWPEVAIVIRGDSGFCREDRAEGPKQFGEAEQRRDRRSLLMAWCEGQPKIDYVLGLAKNSRLAKMLAAEMAQAQAQFEATQQAVRVFKDFRYQTRESWSRARRVVGKAEHLEKGANPRFVVTSLAAEVCDARQLYEERYCKRGEMENRIKEQHNDLAADRTSTGKLRANQLRLYFSSMAYVLVNALRRFGLAGTEMREAQCQTIRLKLLKIGAQFHW